MPIRPYLAGKAFDPETISEMSDALKSVCKALSLKMIDDAATSLATFWRGARDGAAITRPMNGNPGPPQWLGFPSADCKEVTCVLSLPSSQF